MCLALVASDHHPPELFGHRAVLGALVALCYHHDLHRPHPAGRAACWCLRGQCNFHHNMLRHNTWALGPDDVSFVTQTMQRITRIGRSLSLTAFDGKRRVSHLGSFLHLQFGDFQAEGERFDLIHPATHTSSR